MKFDLTAVIGAGAWGTALATLWARHAHNVILWGHDPARAEQLRRTRVNETYLPGVRLPDSVHLTSDLSECANADLVVFVTPSVVLREIAMQLHDVSLNRNATLLSCTKGIEHVTGMRMSEILSEVFPDRQVAVMSGPNLALEVANELPSATVLGCAAPDCAEALQQQLGSERFRIYSSDDTLSIELGGALKNVFAIGAGASDGFGLGDNSKAALITRSLAELLRLGTALGGNPRTFYGLSGAGDLVATCFSRHSRNRRLGEQLGRGRTLDQIRASTQSVAEGVPTTESAFESARKLGIDTPIIDQLYGVLYQGKRPHDAMEELLKRDLKAEQL